METTYKGVFLMLRIITGLYSSKFYTSCLKVLTLSKILSVYSFRMNCGSTTKSVMQYNMVVLT